MIDIDDILNLNIEFYSYEKMILDKNIDLNDDKDHGFYIVNPKWLIDLKKYICYEIFNNEISKYKIEISDLKKNQNIKGQIRNVIGPNIKTNFPQNLKDENYIKAETKSYCKNGKKGKEMKYFYIFNVLKRLEFNSLYNFLNKKEVFFVNNAIFQNNNNNKIIVEIYRNQYEMCHFDNNNNFYICDYIFYLYGEKKEEYLKKLLSYKSLNDFFINEKFEKKEEKDDIIKMMKSGKEAGKIVFINKNFNHNDIFNQSIVNYNLNPSLPNEFYKKKTLNKIHGFIKALIKVIKLYKSLEFFNLLKLNWNLETINSQEELENQKELLYQIMKAKLNEAENLEKEYQKKIKNIQQQDNQKENEFIQNIQNIKSQNENYLTENNNLKDEIKKLNKIINNLEDEIKKIKQQNPPISPSQLKLSMIEQYEKTPEIGLANIGSTCYMNATLQCFSQTAPFTDYFLNPKNKELIIKGKFETNDNKPRLSAAYYEVVQNLWPLNKSSNAKYFSPNKFKIVLGILNELFKKMEASDAKDMIVFFLEQIHKEINLIKPPAVNDQNQNPDQYNRQVMLTHFINELSKTSKSIISDIFFTIAETTQKCQNCFRMNVPNYICYNYSIQNLFIFPLEEVRKFRDNNINQQINMNNQMMIMNPMMGNMGMNPMMGNMGMNPMMIGNMGMNPMMIPNMNIEPNYNTNKVTLYDCFDFNQKDELMCGDNQIYCNKCRQNSDSIYGNKIFTLPDILIMILNRGKDNIYKVIIDFPMEIDLSKYVLSNINKNEKYIYSIYGVITHIGESGGAGHFIASCKSPVENDKDKWFRYNDAYVSPITDFNKEVINFNTPYILFYQRKK